MRRPIKHAAFVLLVAPVLPLCALSQTETGQTGQTPAAQVQTPADHRGITTDDYNQRLEQIKQSLSGAGQNSEANDYCIGPQDLLEISVFQAPELSATVRVSASGEISPPLIGPVQAAGLTTKSLQAVLEELLRRTYMKDPHVSVFVKEMQSHPVSVFGAVKKPGVFQIGTPKTLVEILSMAEGLAEDAGDTIIVMRGAGLPVMATAASPVSSLPQGDAPPQMSADSSRNSSTLLPPGGSQAKSQAAVAEAHSAPFPNADPSTIEVNLKDLLESAEPRYNLPIYPGDVVKVVRAGVVYVEGEVKLPGGFMLKTNEDISVLQAIAMAQGLTRTAARNHARIMRTDQVTGARTEILVNLDKILAGDAVDPVLQPKDVVFIPNSVAKSALYGSTQNAAALIGSAAVYRW
jgi:polysaccharide biosynthesis/export protein